MPTTISPNNRLPPNMPQTTAAVCVLNKNIIAMATTRKEHNNNNITNEDWQRLTNTQRYAKYQPPCYTLEVLSNIVTIIMWINCFQFYIPVFQLLPLFTFPAKGWAVKDEFDQCNKESSIQRNKIVLIETFCNCLKIEYQSSLPLERSCFF